MIDKLAVEKRFDKVIANKFATKPVIKNFLLRHERKPLVLQNLCEEIQKCEAKTYSIKFNVQTYHQVIDLVSEMFFTGAIQKAEHDALSSAEKERLRKESIRMEEIEGKYQEEAADVLSETFTSYPTLPNRDRI